jgi:hypothetical protein
MGITKGNYGLNATMRATNPVYRGSPICRELDDLIRDNAAVIAKIEA